MRLTVDDLEIEVLSSARRRTLELTIERDGSLVVRAPEGCGADVLERFVREKRFWLFTKLAERDAMQRPTVVKEFVSGEGFRYLGRSHRLLLVESQSVPLRLERARFHLVRSEAVRGREHFIRWYTEHARRWLREPVRRLGQRLGVEPAGIEVRDLGYRWGSCGKQGTVNFHWATIMLPPSIVEYVVAHELAHLHEANHTPEFWRRVERAMPDYEARKQWLAEKGGAYVAI